MAFDEKGFRRSKSDPDRDALHTLRIGLMIFLLLLLVLPWVLGR